MVPVEGEDWVTDVPVSDSSALDPSFAPPRTGYPWRVLLFLVLAGAVTSPLIVPYIVGLYADAGAADQLPGSTAGLYLRSLIQTSVVMLVAGGLGLLVARRIGLGAPHLEAWLYRRPAPGPFREVVGPAIFWGVATGLVAFAVDAFFFHALGVTFPAPEIHARIDVAAWRSLLASFWAPFFEETLDRLFLLSLVAWLGMLIFRVRGEGRGRKVALWVATAATAYFFAWYHIGNEALYGEVTEAVAVRTILIILGPGLAFGYLYWRRGLEAAILSHFVIDIVVHFVRPVLEGKLL